MKIKKRIISAIAVITCIQLAAAKPLRAPAYPLVTIDPYTSAWSCSDRLYDDAVRHWTLTELPLIGVAKVDGKDYRFMGKETPLLSPLVNTAANKGWACRYTTSAPTDGWFMPGFDDSEWNEGEGAFGSVPEEPLARTKWRTEYVWVRREVSINEPIAKKPIYLNYSHDDDVTIYVNGHKVVDTGNQCHKDVRLLLTGKARAALKKGKNVIAACCRDRGGLSFLDFGLEIEKRPSRYLPNEAHQVSAEVHAMNTVYSFECGPIDLVLTFTAPAFTDNLELLSRPVNYISYDITSRDGKKHDVRLYFEAGRQWAIDNTAQMSVSSTGESSGIVYATTANATQCPLNRGGDLVRIDWGNFYLAANAGECAAFNVDSHKARRAFAAGKAMPQGSGNDVVLTINAGKVSAKSGFIMAAYDDVYSIQYFGNNLRPYWNRNGKSSIFMQMAAAAKEYSELMTRSRQFDADLFGEATAAGGERYAELCALAYRQAIAAHKLVEAPNGDILWFSKENHSNGSIGTVDITYPSAPMFLYYNPELVKGMMNHIFYYSESGKWTKPFPAHDVGTYPLANGQTYGGDMPVEEGGNMLILSAAIAAVEGNPDYAMKHWNVLTTWADYLVQNGLDPENQLCTDDFAGHFAHNANLSVKAILGVASYAYIARMAGRSAIADRYLSKAHAMASEWEKMATDGDHYKLTFDKPDTWSQKYNLVWDKILKLNIFSPEVAAKEITYYLDKQNKYGLPLDNRETYTKTDWIMWTATLAPDKDSFEKFITPMHMFMNDTRHRVPMSDWIYTDRADQRGFQARSVVGGYFIKMLEASVW